MENKAKEYAQELVNRFMPFTSGWTTYGTQAVHEGKEMHLGRAKQCALICVEIQEKTVSEIWFSPCDDNNIDEIHTFLQSVKQEIEAL